MNTTTIAASTPKPQRRPDKEPKRCGKHPDRTAIWYVGKVGYCYSCSDDARAHASQTAGIAVSRHTATAYGRLQEQRNERYEAGLY